MAGNTSSAEPSPGVGVMGVRDPLDEVELDDPKESPGDALKRTDDSSDESSCSEAADDEEPRFSSISRIWASSSLILSYIIHEVL
jgi:hypothetical protein